MAEAEKRRGGCGAVLLAGLAIAVLAVALGEIGGSANDAAGDAPKTAEELDRDLDYMRVTAVKAAISRALKDPESARWGDVFVSRKGGEPVVCGHVNARNSFGGYTGAQPFIADDAAISGPAEPTAAFARRWNEICAGVPVG